MEDTLQKDKSTLENVSSARARVSLSLSGAEALVPMRKSGNLSDDAKFDTIFDFFDKDKDGVLKRTEFVSLVRSTNPDLQLSEQTIVRDADLLGWWVDAGVTREQLRDCYKTTDGDIAADYHVLFKHYKTSIRDTAMSHGIAAEGSDDGNLRDADAYEFDPEDFDILVRQIFELFDEDKDGLLNRSEYMELVKGTNPGDEIHEKIIIKEATLLGWDMESGVTVEQLMECYSTADGNLAIDYGLLFI